MFSLDALVAVVFIVAAVSVLAVTFQLQQRHFQSVQRVARLEMAAFWAGEYLTTHCANEGGLLDCSDSYREAGRFSNQALHPVSVRTLSDIANASGFPIRYSVDVMDIPQDSPDSPSGRFGGFQPLSNVSHVCLPRLGYVKTKPIIVRVCALDE